MNYQGMLKNSILSKTVFTALCGISLVVASPFIGSGLDINSASLSIVGIALIGFVLPECLLFVTNGTGENSAKFIIAKDIMFITFCFMALGFNLFGVSSAAIALMGMFSVVFAANTYMQHNSLKKKIEMQQVEEAPELRVVYIDAA